MNAVMGILALAIGLKSNVMERVSIHGHSEFWIKDDGILYAKIGTPNMNNRLDVHTAELYIDAIARLSKGKAMPLLIDLRNTKGTFSNEAAQLLARKFKAMPIAICEAYVVNSLSVRLLVHSYKRIFNPDSPFEIFKTVTSAREYCLNCINDYQPSIRSLK